MSSNNKHTEVILSYKEQLKEAYKWIEQLVYYSQIHTVEGVKAANFETHKTAWREAQKLLWRNTKPIDGEYILLEQPTANETEEKLPFKIGDKVQWLKGGIYTYTKDGEVADMIAKGRGNEFTKVVETEEKSIEQMAEDRFPTDGSERFKGVDFSALRIGFVEGYKELFSNYLNRVEEVTNLKEVNKELMKVLEDCNTYFNKMRNPGKWAKRLQNYTEAAISKAEKLNK